MKKYTKDELIHIDAVEIYKMVLQGTVLRTFPKGFWQRHEAKENAIKCIRYLIEDVLKYDEEGIKENLSCRLFSKNKLSGMLVLCFDNSPYKAINNAYPNKFKEWEFKFVPNYYWHNRKNGIQATRWMLEDKLGLNADEIKEKLSMSLFARHGLRGMLNNCFNGSPYEAIDAVYPGRFKEWEFNMVPNKYWNNKNNGIKATKWLIEEELKFSEEELKEKLSINLFKENGLLSMLNNCFNGSPYEAINNVYPDKYKKNDFLGYVKNNSCYKV